MGTDSSHSLYCLQGVDGELLLVFRTYDEAEMHSMLQRLQRSRELKSRAIELQKELNCQQQQTERNK